MKQRRKQYVCLFLLSTIVEGPALVAAAEPPGNTPQALTAAAFLGRVEQSNPRLEVVEGEVATARAEIAAAGLWANPSLAFTREDVKGAGQSLPEQRLWIDLPLDVSGRRGLRVDAAELAARAARRGADRARRDLLLDALGVYWRAAAARLKQDTLEGQRVALADLLAAVRSRTAAGDASGYDLDRLAIEAETLSDLLADTAREVMTYEKALGLLAGAPESSYAATDALTLPALPAPVAADDVLAARPDHQAAKLRIAQAERELDAAGRARVPSLSLSGGAKSAVIDHDTHWGYIAGVALGLPVLNHGQADRERARARRRSAQAEARAIAQQALAQADASWEVLLRTVEQARRFEQSQLLGVDRLLKRAEASYREGERPVFELLDAYRTARAIQLRGIELRLQARLAEGELWRARGLGPGGNP